MKQWKRVVSVLAAVVCLATSALAATHTVQPGDTMWKIAVRYEVGTAEIIEANPQVENPILFIRGKSSRFRNRPLLRDTMNRKLSVW